MGKNERKRHDKQIYFAIHSAVILIMSSLNLSEIIP